MTLDTKILAALTRSAKGDLAQRILTAKEECAKEGKAMRGRQVLFMFDQYFKTSEEAGNLYSLEDLLRVSRHGEGIIDLKRFLNAWDSVIAGMKKPPEEKVLKDILLRQVRSCHLLRYDIDTYDRCRDDDPNKSYDFLMRCMRDLIERDRLRENRERVSKVNASKAPTPKAGAAAPEKRDPKKKSAPKPKDTEEKYCFDFQKGSCTRGANCPYAHRKEPRGRSATRGRPSSPKGGKGEKAPCSFFAQGKCTRGDKCKFSHASTGGKSAAAASSSEANANPAAKKRANSPKPKPKAKAAAVCTRYAMFAKPIDPIGVSFDTNAHVHEIPAEGDGFKLEYEERQYNRMFPSAKDCPRPTKGTNKAARKAANQLNAVVKAMVSMEPSPLVVSCAMWNPIPSQAYRVMSA